MLGDGGAGVVEPLGASDEGQIAESLHGGTNVQRACAPAPGGEEVRDLKGRQPSSAYARASAAVMVRASSPISLRP
jgi:hypothetical protein